MSEDLKTKKCTNCNEILPFTSYSFPASCNGRPFTYCKECAKIRANKYKEKNREKVLKQKKEWNKNNPDRIKSAHKKRYSDSTKRQKMIDTATKWRKDNPHRYKELRRKYYENYGREYFKKRRKNDIIYKIKASLRTRLYIALKKGMSSDAAFNFLGCTIEELKDHIESQFQEGMTWNNWSRGGWSLDHIIPLSAFDLTDKEQVKKACHYSNLQPLWEADNIRKGGKKK